MIRYAPVLKAPRLGQSAASLLTGGITQQIAQSIVSAAEPPTRAIVRDEMNRLAEGLIGGIPYAAAGGVAYVATRYLVPDGSNSLKFAGYAAAFLSLGVGAWFTFSQMTQIVQSTPPSGSVPAVVTQTAEAIVDAAQPKIVAIVDEERTRISQAAQAGLPYYAAAALAAIASALFIPEDKVYLKAAGYSGAIGIGTLGTYVALGKEIS